MKSILFLALAAVAAGCGGNVVIDSGAGGQGGQGGGGGPINAPACGSGNGAMLAIDRLLVGDKNPDGSADAVNGWKQYGFNLDGLSSTGTSTNVCKPVLGAFPQTVHQDGNEGRDNAFGKNVLPIFLGVDADMSEASNGLIKKGAFTWLLSAPDLGQGSACKTPIQMFLGTQTKPPQWNGQDVWPIDPSSLQNPSDPATPKWVFPENVIDEQNLVTSTEPGTVDLIFLVAGQPLRLSVHHAFLQFRLTPDHSTATSGMLGGILDPNELTTEIVQIAGAVDPTLCDLNTPTMKAILTQLRQAADIMLDGTQDPNKDCDGISIGIGFTMKAANLGSIGPAAPPPPNTCP